MWHKNRSLSILVVLLLCFSLVFSFVPIGLALEPQSEETEVYLPLVLRRHLYKESSGVLDPSFSGDGLALANFGSGPTQTNAVVVQSDGKIVTAGTFWGINQDFVLIRYNPDGSLDPTFDGDGWLLTDFGGDEIAQALALQSDGKIIAAGNMDHQAFALARYNPDGSLDTTFDGDGKVLLTGQDVVRGVVVQNDGKIIVAGYVWIDSYDFALARYNPDGSLDTSFDGDGIVMTDIVTLYGSNNRGNAITLQTDGKILVTGYADGYGGTDIAVVRYNSDGSLDTTFSEDGIQTTNFASNEDVGNAIKVQQDGKIVVAGSTAMTSDNFALVRYNADGSLDPTFSSDGMTNTDFTGEDDWGYALLLPGDGTILVAGAATGTSLEIGVACYTTNGVLDVTFDTDGKMSVDFSTGDVTGYSAELQVDGKLLVAGTNWGEIRAGALARINSDGSLDGDFSGDGKVLTQVAGSEDDAAAMALQPDGKLVVAGFSNGGTQDFALGRFNPDGNLDAAFSDDGIVVAQVGSGISTIQAVAIQPDGKIIVAGGAEGITSTDFVLARYNPDGSLDTTFDGDGKLNTDFSGGADIAFSVALQTDGKIVIAGEATVASNIDFGLARYNPNGSLDTTFDGDGKLSTDFSAGYDHASAVTVQTDGKICVAGYSYGSSMFDFGLARYNPNGSLDTTFNDDGKLVTDFAGDMDLAAAMVLQPNGKIVVTGNATTASSDFALARYNPDGSLDTSFDGDGLLVMDNAGVPEYARAIVLQPNGAIVIAGMTGNGTDIDFAVLRYR